MPLFRFYCDPCSADQRRLQNEPDVSKVTCKACGGPVRLVVGSPAMEEKVTTNEYFGKKRDPRAEEKAYERAQENYRKHEIPRIVDEKGKGFAVDQGVLKYDGTPLKGRSKH